MSDSCPLLICLTFHSQSQNKPEYDMRYHKTWAEVIYCLWNIMPTIRPTWAKQSLREVMLW